MSDWDERAAEVVAACGPLGNVTSAALREWFRHGGQRAFVRFAYDYPPPRPPAPIQKKRQRLARRNPERVRRIEHELARYINDGWTLEQIAAEQGVTREAIRSDLQRYVPVLYQWAKHRRSDRAFLAKERPQRLCVICGADLRGLPPNTRSRRRFCSDEHYDAYMYLRYQLMDDEGQARHRELVFSWVERHPDYEGPVRAQHIENVRSGRNQRRGHWITRGSKVAALATEAYEKGWPVFALLRPEVQQQVRNVLLDPLPPNPQTPTGERRKRTTGTDLTTRRELVAMMRAEGRIMQEIADYLAVSVSTVAHDLFWLRHGHH